MKDVRTRIRFPPAPPHASGYALLGAKQSQHSPSRRGPDASDGAEQVSTDGDSGEGDSQDNALSSDREVFNPKLVNGNVENFDYALAA